MSSSPLAAQALPENHWQKLIDTSEDIIYEADARGHFTFVNPAVRSLLGYEPQAVIGMHFSALVRDDWRKTVIDHYRAASRSTTPPKYLEFPAISKDGRTVWIGQSVQPIIVDGEVTGFQAIARDVTERREAQERFDVFMANSPTVAFIKDADGRYVYANDLMTRVFAPPGGSLIGTTDFDLLPLEIAKRVHANDERVLRMNHPVQVIEAVPDAEGTSRHWLTYKFPVSAPDGRMYTGGVAVDLSARINLEKELAAARDAALESARLKSEFLANMSHEIRTPMNGVIGLIGLLVDSKLDADQRELAETARSSAEALLTIINDILDFSKIEAGKLSFEAHDFDAREAVESTIDLLAQTAAAKKLEIGYVVDPDIPATVRGDKGRLRQVLLNMIGNAVKFTSQGGVLVQVERESADAESVTLRFRISDTGVGLSEAVKQRIFQPFVQADSSTTRRFGGTGLGLAISKQLVQMMHGEIGVESEPGCGSTFWFTARFGCYDKRPAMSLVPASTPRVLVVEDSTTTRQLIALQLTAWRVAHETAENALQALTMLRDQAAAGVAYDLVISDVHLAELDGVALARLIKNSSAFGSPRVVLATSAASPIDASTLAEAGVTTVLRKPVRQEHLFSAVFGAAPLRPTVAPPKEETPLPRRSSRRVLVVEDNVVNQKVAVRQLEKLGYKADVAGNGIEAVAAVARIAYDLVLMDCQMPELDGYGATAAIRRAEGDGPRTPIIALTASARDADRDRCLAAGMDDFLPKPLTSTALQSAMQKWLPKPEGERS